MTRTRRSILSFRATLGIPLFLSLALLPLALPASAQVATGTPPFNSFGGGPDVINLGNLNVHLCVPVLHKPGRGTNFFYDLCYDSSVWSPLTSGSTTTWNPGVNWGWSGVTLTTVGYASHQVHTLSCRFFKGRWITEYYHEYDNWSYVDSFGTSHRMSYASVTDNGAPDCGPGLSSANIQAIDGSGYQMAVDGTPSATLTTAQGAVSSLPVPRPSGGKTYTDRNGNEVSTDTNGNFYDTLSSTAPALTVSGSPPNPVTFTYTAPSGASAAFTMVYTTYSIQTNFGCTSPNIGEYGTNGTTTGNLVTEIRLPDWNQNTNPNSRYTFTYEDTPQHSGFKTGRLTSITLPTGGVISYTYTAGALTGTAVGANDPIVCADGSAAGIQRKTPDTGTNYWNYSRGQGTGNQWTTTVTTPPDPSVGNDTVIYFQKDSNTTTPTNNFYETQRKAYQGSSTGGTLLRTVDTCYNTTASPCTGTAVSSPITQRDILPSIPSAGAVTLESKHTTKYNSVGGLTEVDDYAFGSGAPPSTALRQTLITYASLPPNITAFRQTVTVKNGSGTVVGQTNYNYDQTTPVNAPSGTPQLTGVTGSRGNLTSVQRCTNLTNCSAYLQTTMTYDTAGQLQTVTDPLNNQTSFSYSDNFLDDDGSNPPSKAHTLTYPTDAYVTSVTPPLNGAITMKHYFYNGGLALATDQNNNSSWSHFDSIGRPSSAYGPTLPIAGSPSPGNANPWTLISYTSPTQIDTYSDINDTSTAAVSTCTVCRHDEAVVDGLGRGIHGYLVSDPEGQTQVDTVYDALGRVQSNSHPYRSTSDNTYGIETPTYDPLGRTTKVTHPDTTYSLAAFGANVTGSNVNTSQFCSSTTYGLGYPSLYTDESGRQREIWTDAFGRTIEADEPDSSGSLKNSYVCYSYDPLGNLLQIVRSGTPSQTRTYQYDALSRVTSVTIPELANSSGANCAVTYTYDNNSNVQTRTTPAPNQTSCSTTVTTTYYHDALNRLTKITYSDGSTPTVQYVYDNATPPTGCTPPSLTDNNPKGHVTAMCDGSGAASWAHDAAGRVITEMRKIIGTSTVTQTLSYSYNLDGSIYSVTYPSGKAVNYTVSNAQRLTQAKDSAGAPQYALLASYAPTGALQQTITGQISGGFGGVTEKHSYNSSLEYTTSQALPPAGAALMDLSLAYNLNPPNGGQDNGTVTKITNNADNGRTQTLGYDPLNRISSAASQATSGTDCWGQNFAPDALANLNTITSAQCNSNSLSVSVDGNNHITTSGFGYDAAGNMSQDGSGTGYSYTFDAENRLVKATGMSGGPYCYVYDGLGLRVAKKSGANSDCTGGTYATLYWRSLSGDTLTETDGSGSFATPHAYNEYVFFAGRRIASRVTYTTGKTGIFYYFVDQLGSTRTITTGSGQNSDGSNQTPGQLCYDQDYTPYGQEVFTTSQMTRLQTTACPPNYKFTGYERDPETGLDYAFARYYSSRLGRFLSTDPLGGSIGDLQSHNAYAYVVNNPLNFTDPFGLCGRNPQARTPCPDPDAPNYGPCGLDCGGAGGFLFGSGGPACYLNGSPASCSMVNSLLSNPSGSTYLNFPGFKYKGDTAYGSNCYAGIIVEEAFCLGDFFWSTDANTSGGGQTSGGGNASGTNNGTTQQQAQQCVQQFYNSAPGKVVQFGSVLSVIPGWNSNWAKNLGQWTEAIAGKGGGTVLSQVYTGTEQITTLTGTTTVASSFELTVQAGLQVLGKVASIATGYATGLDILAHATCQAVARENAGQMTPLPPGIHF